MALRAFFVAGQQPPLDKNVRFQMHAQPFSGSDFGAWKVVALKGRILYNESHHRESVKLAQRFLMIFYIQDLITLHELPEPRDRHRATRHNGAVLLMKRQTCQGNH